MSTTHNGFGDTGDLRRCLSLTQHDFGESLARGSLVVDAREPQILNRITGGQQARVPFGVFGIEPAVADGLEERP